MVRMDFHGWRQLGHMSRFTPSTGPSAFEEALWGFEEFLWDLMAFT